MIALPLGTRQPLPLWDIARSLRLPLNVVEWVARHGHFPCWMGNGGIITHPALAEAWLTTTEGKSAQDSGTQQLATWNRIHAFELSHGPIL